MKGVKRVNLQNLIDYSKIYNEPDPLYGVELPSPLDAEKCKSAILMRCGLLEPVYNDPRVFREMIYTWFHIRDWNFKHLIAIIQAEYSPIENTDRYSEHEIITAGTDSKSREGTDERKIGTTGSDNRVIGTTGSDSRTRTPDLTRAMTDEISAENSSEYQPDSKHTTHDTGTETTAGSRSENVTNDLMRSENVTDNLTRSETESGKRDGSETYTEHTHGNIGVTSNVQLISEEIELIRRFNVYDWIAERIEETFFIMIY